MQLELVIVSFKSERWLPRCLQSVYQQGFEGRCWLVDNHELEPAVRDRLLDAYPKVTYLQAGGNLGFGGGNNLGIERALEGGADVVGLINPDTWLEPGWDAGMLDTLAAFPALGLAAPLQLGYEGDTLADWTRGALGISSMDDPRLRERLLPAQWIEASALFVRREVFEAIGGFDPLFALYFEDNDLCRRARLRGFQMAVVPSVRYHHFGGGTLDGRSGRERGIRCDLGQALYVLTDPQHSIGRNLLSAARLLARRGIASIRRDGPLDASIWPLLARVVPLVWTQRRQIHQKWRRDASQAVVGLPGARGPG